MAQQLSLQPAVSHFALTHFVTAPSSPRKGRHSRAIRLGEISNSRVRAPQVISRSATLGSRRDARWASEEIVACNGCVHRNCAPTWNSRRRRRWVGIGRSAHRRRARGRRSHADRRDGADLEPPVRFDEASRRAAVEKTHVTLSCDHAQFVHVTSTAIERRTLRLSRRRFSPRRQSAHQAIDGGPRRHVMTGLLSTTSARTSICSSVEMPRRTRSPMTPRLG